MNLNNLTIEQAHEGLKRREFSARALTQACLDCLGEKNEELNAFLEIWPQEALDQAEAIDEHIAAGEEIGPLAGIPIAVKDNICVADKHTTAGSHILEEYVSPYDATVIERLRAAGVVLLGKTNLDEFAMGSSTEHSAFGPTRNPYDTDRVPGGSSGGSAAAVAAGMCLGALGSDTGGSIRQPASFCGVVGMKPSYGRVSRHGLVALGSSLDQIGPFATSVKGARLLYAMLATRDDLDTTTIMAPNDGTSKKGFQESTSFEGLTVGLPQEYFAEGLADEVNQAIDTTLEQLKKAGVRFKNISLPHTTYALAAYYIIMPAEASANLARYDGVRYAGVADRAAMVQEAANLITFYKAVRSRGFGHEPKRRIMLGTFALSAGYYDAYYGRAQRVRRKIREDFETAFSSVDIILTPTSPTTAFRLGEKTDDPLAMYLSDIYTVTANLAGIPGISLPIPTDGLPIGLQLLAPHSLDEQLFSIAGCVEELLGSQSTNQ